MTALHTSRQTKRRDALAHSLDRIRGEVIASLRNLAMLNLMGEISQIQADAMGADLEAILETVPHLPAPLTPVNQEVDS